MKLSVGCLLSFLALISVTLAQDAKAPECNPEFTQKVRASWSECNKDNPRKASPAAAPESSLVSSLLSRYRRETEEDSSDEDSKDERFQRKIAMFACMEEKLTDEKDYKPIKDKCESEFNDIKDQKICIAKEVRRCSGWDGKSKGENRDGNRRGRGKGPGNGDALSPVIAPIASVFLY